MKNKYKVMLVRHAATGYNKMGFVTGQKDIEILRDVIVDKMDGFDGAVYSSPLKRCRQTLEKLCFRLMDSVVYDSRLIERDMGVFEGQRKCEIRKKYPDYFINGKINIFNSIAEGESYDELFGRTYSFYLDRIVNTEKDILICGHNQILKVLKAILLKQDITIEYWLKNNFENGKIYEYNIAQK